MHNKVFVKIGIVLIASVIIPFSAGSQGVFNSYFGNLHSHTSVSDGTGTPAEAYTYARYTAGLDFLAVTDHLEQIQEIPFINEEWSDMQDAADNATVNGTFVGIAGWEWGSPLHGHVNVFNTSDIITDAVNLWYTTDLPAFYNWVLTHTPAFAQFNHPGDESYFTNWNNFQYVSNSLDLAFPLIEFQTVDQANTYYSLALNNGWRLSPVWNQDNHSADWGNKNDCRAGIWATALTRPALFEAINAGRTFATMDKNARVWIDLSGCPMGSEATVQPLIPLHILLSDADNESWTSVQMFTNNGILNDIGAHTGNLDTTFNISMAGINWIYVRAQQSDGNYIWSAPVYITGTLTGTVDLTTGNNLMLFPNPATDHLWAYTGDDDSRIEIFDMQGKLIYQAQFQKTIRLNTAKINPGVYITRISASRHTHISKLLIQ